MHGKTTTVEHNGGGVFIGLPQPLIGTRYHSLVVEEQGLPEDLQITARAEGGLIMGMQHRQWPTHGVQFHPESIATPSGPALLENFLQLIGEHQRQGAPC